MRSVHRVLAVFESFSADRPRLSLQEIADRIELPKSTAFRIVRSLEQAGYLIRLSDLSYGLSLRFSKLAGVVESTMDIREVARPILADLARDGQETASLHLLENDQRVCLEAVNASSALRNVVQPGEHVLLAHGSATKVLVAFAQDPDDKLVRTMAINSGRSFDAVSQELTRVRQLGYAISHGERLQGVSAISAPIWDRDNTVQHCISLGGPSFRMAEREPELVVMVRQAAALLSLKFGGGSAADFPLTEEDDDN